jgi:hypothetical protein
MKTETAMNLIARLDQKLSPKLITWHLLDEAGHLYGQLNYNGFGADQYRVFIFSTVHPDLGSKVNHTFDNRAEALAWAREQIIALEPPTEVEILNAIERVKQARYSDEMSDDYAYSNGKVARWDRIKMELQAKLRQMEEKV